MYNVECLYVMRTKINISPCSHNKTQCIWATIPAYLKNLIEGIAYWHALNQISRYDRHCSWKFAGTSHVSNWPLCCFLCENIIGLPLKFSHTIRFSNCASSHIRSVYKASELSEFHRSIRYVIIQAFTNWTQEDKNSPLCVFTMTYLRTARANNVCTCKADRTQHAACYMMLHVYTRVYLCMLSMLSVGLTTVSRCKMHNTAPPSDDYSYHRFCGIFIYQNI